MGYTHYWTVSHSADQQQWSNALAAVTGPLINSGAATLKVIYEEQSPVPGRSG